MSERPISESIHHWLTEEVGAWQADGILSEDQAKRILARYSSQSDAEARRTRGVFTLMAAAALLVGLAVLLLIGYNWEAMPAAVKLVIIFGVVLGTHWAGFQLRYKRQVGTLSEVVFFLGCLFYGAGIWLVAQVFHLNAHYPDGIWFWALGVLPFALCLDTLLLHLLLVALLGIWAGTEVLGFNDLGASLLFGRWRWIPNGAYSLPLLAAPGILWAYRKKSAAALSLYVPLLAWWVVLQPFAWRLEDNPTYFIGAVGALMLLVAECHPVGSRFAVPYRYWGVLLIGGVLFALSFSDFNRMQLQHGNQSLQIVQTIAIAALTVLMIAVALAMQQPHEAGSTSAADRLVGLAKRQAIPFSFILLMLLLGPWNEFCRSMEYWRLGAVSITVVANVALLVCCWWLVSIGLREDRGRPFAAGVGFFLLWTMVRYFDLFGSHGGMLGASVMFFLCGAALFGVATYWKNRKEAQRG